MQQPADFHELFRRVTALREIFRHGIGDGQFKAYLDMWAATPSPLVKDNGTLEITLTGRSVINNRVDAIQINGIDLWYGGVHLTAGNQWRWNSERQKLERVGL